MEYISRALETKFLHMSSFFKAVLVTGARQVGKTTMLRRLAQGQGRTYVSLDDTMVRDIAQSDPVLFFQRFRPPVIIDEIQKAPQLFNQIKIICDSDEQPGQFWLTGSQQFNMMKNVRESLAGRVCVMRLYSLSQSEKNGSPFTGGLDFSMPCLMERQQKLGPNNIVDVFENIWKGGMPAIQAADAEQREAYFSSYIDTYLMRDAAEAGGISDAVRFRKFLNVSAALSSCQLNYSTLAEASDISQPTAKEWLRTLEGMGIVFLLQPFAANELKRLTKKPKLYFCDTGLCAYLSKWLTRDTLMNGAASGRYFENFVAAELLKNFAYAKSGAGLSYYRDSNGKEIDFIVEENGLLHPLEVKLSANPDKREVKKFAVLDGTSAKRGDGGIVCMCEAPLPIDDRDAFIPCNLI